MDRFYSFKVVTYNTDESSIKPLLDKAFKWAWILHDKDETAPHIHILCTFKQNKSFEQVRKMVEGKQNTFARKMEDKYRDYLYLPHSEEFPEKALYEESDIHCNDTSFFQRGAKKTVDNEEFIMDLLDKNMTLRQMAIKYGRDFMRNLKTYQRFAKLVRIQENLLNGIVAGVQLEEDTAPYSAFDTVEQVEVDEDTGEIIDHKKKAEE